MLLSSNLLLFTIQIIFLLSFFKKLEGVVAFFSAEDIPGENNYYPPNLLKADDEKVFVIIIILKIPL